ncbi:PREDICTED: perforin-1-like isoform X1 [Poecilia mexicana]|uniref:perforin-1-like isoform X1 n=1 Tax=Poecilia mexicana TaxID=48701 RepID=UPI00072D9906|nr:PREDICTED: perforin-1-like isoform X1 [Poecilia mexicana]
MPPDSTSALLLLSVLLVHSSVLSCRTGTQTECDAAPFVPGHNLVGEGFDIVRLQRKGAYVMDMRTYLSPNKTCVLCPNPLQDDVLQKLPSSVVDWRAISRCSADIFSSHHTSASSLVQAYSSQDNNDWSVGLDVPIDPGSGKLDVEGTRSKAYKFALERSKEDRYTFSIHSVTCSHYGFRMSIRPSLSLELKKHLEILPSHYDSSTKNDYDEFIHTYGTHFFKLVNLGGRMRRLTSSRSCLSSLNGLTSSEVHNCLSMGVAVGLGKVKLPTAVKACSNVLQNQDSSTNYTSGLHHHHTEMSGGNGWVGEFSLYQNDSKSYLIWLKSLKEHPDVVSYSLRPLYQLVPNKVQKAAVKAAIEQYLKDNAVKKSPPEPHCEGKIPNLASNCCPLQASRGTLVVTILRGYNLKGDLSDETEGYVQVFYGTTRRTTRMIVSNNPKWNEDFNFGKVDTTLALKIEIWDQDYKNDDLLAKCEEYLSQGTHTFTCKGKYGRVDVIYTLKCDPYLTGEKCSRYHPSPK